MPFTYKSGEEIGRGDRVKLHGYPVVVLFVVHGPTRDPAMNWYFEEFDGGVMIFDDAVGQVFLSRESLEEEDVGGLKLVSRAQEGPT